MRSVIKLPSIMLDDRVTVLIPKYIIIGGCQHVRRDVGGRITYVKGPWPAHVLRRATREQLTKIKRGE